MFRFVIMLSTAALVALNATSVAILHGAFDVAVPDPLPPRAYLAKKCQGPECDFALLDAIAWCESKWQMVPNGVSTAYGYFQIIDGTEASTPIYQSGGSKYDPYDNVDMGIFLYQRDGINPWLSSRPCWHWKYQGNVTRAEERCIGASCQDWTG